LCEDSRGFYRFTKSKRRESIGIPPLKVNKEQIFSDNDKANCLNNYFSSVFTNERLDNIPKLESSYPNMPMFTVTVPGVFKLLSKLNPKKSTGPDELSPLVLKETASDISVVLTFIYNQSLSSGTVLFLLTGGWLTSLLCIRRDPRTWLKTIVLFLLHLSVVKTLGHIVYSNVCKFLDSNNILTHKQHGFRPGFSCETQLSSFFLSTIGPGPCIPASALMLPSSTSVRPLTLFLIPDFLASCITMVFAAKFLPGFLLFYSTVINELL